MKNNKIALGVSLIVSGLALPIANANAASYTMYNLTTAGAEDFSSNTAGPCAPCNAGDGTDGWVWGFQAPSNGTDTSAAKWAGTNGLNKTPFGYTGSAPLHWAIYMTSNGSAEISSQDAFDRYEVGADIDTAKGAWSDAILNGAQGWRHDLEFGIFKSDVGGKVTLNAEGVNQSGTNFGFTIFKGMDQSTGAYNHHGGWNANNNSLPTSPNASSLPAGGTSFTVADIVAYSVGGSNPSNLNTITFNAEAGQEYTIVLGGYRNGSWGETVDGYKVNVSAVPIPAAAWLFGSALAGLGWVRQRKNK
jgi:hypothetical protein